MILQKSIVQIHHSFSVGVFSFKEIREFIVTHHIYSLMELHRFLELFRESHLFLAVILSEIAACFKEAFGVH